jgi:hypothetical protein
MPLRTLLRLANMLASEGVAAENNSDDEDIEEVYEEEHIYYPPGTGGLDVREFKLAVRQTADSRDWSYVYNYVAARVAPEGVTPLPSGRGVENTKTIGGMAERVARRLAMRRSDTHFSVLWEACLALCVESESMVDANHKFDVEYFQRKLVYVCIESLGAGVGALGDVAWERNNFLSAVSTVARDRQSDVLVGVVMEWDWLIPSGVRSRYDDHDTSANTEPDRIRNDTCIGSDYRQEMLKSERGIAVQLGIGDGESIYRVLVSAVECAAMLKSDARGCFNIAKVRQNLVSVCYREVNPPKR